MNWKDVDPRIAAMTQKIAGEKLGKVLDTAEDMILLQGKKPERALADALEKHRLL